ncbi:MAG: hypothetical protein KY475_23680, partial [Planctomycetes bacterium]|nr:hypothetical protein [Planctomycetota bacterium]
AGVTWAGTPLRNALEDLGREQNVPVMLDRRIDPDQTVEFALRAGSLERLVREFAARLELGVCWVDSVAYVGPPETTAKLSTVAAIRRREAERLPHDAALRWARVRAWEWPRLTVPRQLIEQLTAEGGFEIVNPDVVPHDLWPEVRLPPLRLADRLTLVLAGFNMTYRLSPDGSQFQLTPMPETAVIAQTYPGKGRARENAEILGRLLPEAEVTVEGEAIRVVGPWETHQDVETLMQGGRVSRTTASSRRTGRTVYSLRVENEPVGGVIKALAQQMMLEVTIDPAAEASLPTLISFNVTDVSRDELFRAVLTPAGLAFRLSEDELHVMPGVP